MLRVVLLHDETFYSHLEGIRVEPRRQLLWPKRRIFSVSWILSSDTRSIKGVWGSAASRTVSGSIPGGVTGNFSVATYGTMCPGVDSASKNEYQGFILG
jgi:hypothetical protein